MRKQLLGQTKTKTTVRKQNVLTGVRLDEIEQLDQFLVAAGGEEVAVRAEVDALHDVVVLERVELLAGDGVPHFAGEVGGAARRPRRVSVEGDAPHRALVPLERADPVACVALT